MVLWLLVIQVAQVLLTLPYSFSQMGMLSGILLQIFYGLMGSWTAYLISILYVEYRSRKEKENVSFKNHVIQVSFSTPPPSITKSNTISTQVKFTVWISIQKMTFFFSFFYNPFWIIGQWFEVLDGLLGPYWKAVGLAFNCTFLLFGSVIQLIACARSFFFFLILFLQFI